jgi:hypothetical protein
MSDTIVKYIATAFFERVFKHCTPSDYISIWSGTTKHSRFVPIVDLPYAASVLEALDKQNEDVYYGVAPHNVKPQKGRGTQHTASALPGLFLDVDLALPDTMTPEQKKLIHKAAKPGGAAQLPPDEATVLAILAAAGIPHPNLIVNSGYGAHFYWLADTPLAPQAGLQALKGIQALARKAASEQGYHIDQTSDLARVLRIPGARNHKADALGIEAPLVMVTYDDSDTMPAADLLKFADHANEQIPKAPGTDGPGAGIVEIDPDKTIDLDTLKIRLGKVKDAEQRAIVGKLLAGESFAQPGDRDRALQQVCSIVAFVSGGHTSPTVLAALFEPALTKWEEEGHDDMSHMREVVLDKLERACADKRRKEAEDIAEAESFRTALISEARSVGAPPGAEIKATTYDKVDIDRFCKDHQIDEATLQKRWIIQHGESCYVMCEGRYLKPIHVRQLQVSAIRDLAPAAPMVELRVFTKNGSRAKSPIELVSEYGQVARQTVAELGAAYSFYDGQEQTFHEAVAALRPITPMYHPQIDRWLRSLGGADADKLLDWIATITDLSRSSSALYLTGAKSAGKSMLAQGLARLWTDGGPALLENVLDKFNDDLTRCPLMWADEQLPQTWGKKSASTKLREVITADTRTLNRKFLPGASLKGAGRVVLTANNERMLALGDEDTTVEDVEAFLSRFLHIRVGRKPGLLLSGLGGRSATEGWVDGDMIAAHALWLRDNRQVIPGDRLLVEPDPARTHNISALTRAGEQVVEWLTRYMAEQGSNVVDVYVGDGEVLVNAKAISDGWSAQMSDRAPPTGQISRVLKQISLGAKRMHTPDGYKRFHSVDLGAIYKFAEETQIGDVEKIRERANVPRALGAGVTVESMGDEDAIEEVDDTDTGGGQAPGI